MKRTFQVGLGLATAANAEVYFSESFENTDKWVNGKWKGDQGEPFELCAGKFAADSENTGYCTKKDHRFYTGVTKKDAFDSFSNKDKKLIVQFSANYQKDIECGGGYLKLGPKMDGEHEDFKGETPYNIMFGPDKCGYTKRTHLIFSYKGKNVLKKGDIPYKQDEDGITKLYRLTVDTDNSVKVEIDATEVFSGSLEKDWDLLPAKEIDDPDDKKPSDWVDQAEIDDPESVKPDDWVEDKQIPDPEAEKPADWDDEEDGEWEKPVIDNPDYKGEWEAKKIPNPEYKGIWKPKKIDNPEYDADAAKTLYAYDDFSWAGFDLWQVKAVAIFDDLILTDDVAEADKLKDKWEELVKAEREKKTAEADAKKKEEEKKAESTDSSEIDTDDDTADDDEEL